jgi:hypothetical protein
MMSVFQYLGAMTGMFSKGYRLIIDQYTTAGAIYFGIAPSGTLKSDAKWHIVKLLQTESNKINDFEWAGRDGMKNDNKIWNKRADGTYTYQTD